MSIGWEVLLKTTLSDADEALRDTLEEVGVWRVKLPVFRPDLGEGEERFVGRVWIFLRESPGVPSRSESSDQL